MLFSSDNWLTPVSGPCRAYIPVFFWDPVTEQCEIFIYGGCAGNDNRFLTEEECLAKCQAKKNDEAKPYIDIGFPIGSDHSKSHSVPETKKPEKPHKDADVPVLLDDSTPDIEPRIKEADRPEKPHTDIGLPDLPDTLYGLNNPKMKKQGNSHQPITSSGAPDISDRLPKKKPEKPYNDIGLPDVFDKPTLYINHKDTARKDKNPVEPYIDMDLPDKSYADHRTSDRRVEHDSLKDQPKPEPLNVKAEKQSFVNSYLSPKCNGIQKDKKLRFSASIRKPRANSNQDVSHVNYGRIRNTNICSAPPDTGRCLGYIPSYCWNTQLESCEKFIYGGCGGNSNNFKTKEECEAACKPRNVDPRGGRNVGSPNIRKMYSGLLLTIIVPFSCKYLY